MLNRHIIVVLGFVFFITSAPVFALDKETQLEIRRVEQRIGRVNETNQQLRKQVRDLERKLSEFSKKFKIITEKTDDLTDTVIKATNVDIASLKTGQKAIFQKHKELYKWGEKERDCKEINTKHQQVEAVKNDDGTRTLRFLCFDGRAVHLSTELNETP